MRRARLGRGDGAARADPGQRFRARGRAPATRSTRSRALKRRYPEHRFIWLMGADTVAQFHQWRDWRSLAANGADCGDSPARAMMALPARRARWAGCGGSSAPQPGEGTGRNGVHRRLSSFACRPIRLPPPPARARPQLAPPTSRSRSRSQRALPIRRGDHLADLHTATAATGRTPIDVEDAASPRHAIARRRPGGRGRLHPAGRQVEHRRPYGDRLRPLDRARSRRWRTSSPKDQASSSAGSSGSKGLPVADWVLIDADDVIVHLVPARSAKFLQSRADVGVRR